MQIKSEAMADAFVPVELDARALGTQRGHTALHRGRRRDAVLVTDDDEGQRFGRREPRVAGVGHHDDRGLGPRIAAEATGAI